MRILMTGPIEKSGGVSTHTKMLVKELKKKRIDVDLYNTSPKKKNDIKLINDLVKLFKKSFGISFKIIKNYRKVDLVHIQASGPLGGFMTAVFASLLKIILKFNLVITFHHGKSEEFTKKHKSIMRLVISRSTFFILVSESQKKSILKYLGNKYKSKIIVIPNGFNSSLFYPMDNIEVKRKLNLPLDKNIILNVANLLSVKGQRYLIEAVKELVKHRKDILCIIVGDGILRKDLKAQIKKLDLGNYVKLAGSKLHDEIPLWMNAADLFVLPSLSEGSPTVLFESLGTGLPFVGTNVGGVPEIITSEDYGFLCEPAKQKDLADMILIGLDKKWDRERILDYVRRFMWENIAKEIIEIYKFIGLNQ